MDACHSRLCKLAVFSTLVLSLVGAVTLAAILLKPQAYSSTPTLVLAIALTLLVAPPATLVIARRTKPSAGSDYDRLTGITT